MGSPAPRTGALADEAKILERGIGLDGGQRHGGPDLAFELDVHDGEPGIFRIVVAVAHDPGEPDDRLFVPGMVDEGVVTRAHAAEMPDRDRVRDPVPARAPLAGQVRKRISVRVGFQNPVGHR